MCNINVEYVNEICTASVCCLKGQSSQNEAFVKAINVGAS